MLITNRRHSILYSALAGLEISWYAPLMALLLVYLAPRSAHTDLERLALLSTQPVLAVGLLWALLCSYLLLVDWLDRREVDSPFRQLAMLAAWIFTTLLAIHFLLPLPAGSDALVPWSRLLTTLFVFDQGVRPELLILLLNFFLWFRVAAFTDRDIGFFSVGMSFRVGVLLALAANGLLTTLGGQPPQIAMTYFTLTIAFGLLAVALARVDDKAQGVNNSTGALLPWSRLFYMLLMIGATIAAAFALAYVITPNTLRTVLGWTLPLWQLLGALLVQVLIVILIALTPFFEWLAALIQANMSEVPPMGPLGFGPDDVEPLDFGETADRAALLRYCLVTLGIAGAVGLLWLFFVRAQRRLRVDEQEEAEREESGPNSQDSRLGLDRLRTWLRLLRRYGLGGQLLAAVSVENIYANTLRMAAARGYKRGASVAPDRFVATLSHAFPNREDALQRITFAYMRVYYGSRAIGPDELSQIKADYQSLRIADKNSPGV